MRLAGEERFARLRLARTDRVGPVAFSQLLARHGSALAALDALPQIVRRSGGSLTPPAPERIETRIAAEIGNISGTHFNGVVQILERLIGLVQ